MMELVRVNKLESCYFRPLVIRGYGTSASMPTKDNPTETYVACWEWGKYLGDEGARKRHRRLRVELDSHGPQYPARDG